MNLNIGLQKNDSPNGYSTICEWLKHDGIYEKINFFENFECEYVDVENFNKFYFFPINGNNRDTRCLSEEYFFGKYLSDKVINDASLGNCIIHLNWLDEPYVYDDKEIKRLNNFLYENEISWENILFTSNNFSIKFDKHTAINFAESSIECDTHYLGFKMIDDNIGDDKRYSIFLSLSRTPHNHRKSLVKFFESYDNEDIMYSALWKDKRIDDRFHWPNVHNEKGMNHGDKKIDLSNFKQDPYLNTYISIVTETNFDNEVLQVTDKVFKPIVNLQPFIYVSSFGGLQHIRDLGYHTFDFIDESYDLIKDEEKRLRTIKNEVHRLINLGLNDIHDIYYGIIDVLRYNRKHWLSVGRYRVIKQMEVFYQNIRNKRTQS
tara:strand:+ start:3242 stop:4369 length:1128 start_codon:yes stop_codon:yes gene_type:complete